MALEVAAYDVARGQLFFTATFAAGTTLTIGSDPRCDIVLNPSFGVARHELVVAGDYIALDDHMRLHMCDADGENHVRAHTRSSLRQAWNFRSPPDRK